MADPLAAGLGPLLGSRTAKALETGLDVRTVGDLLRHYPRRYAQRGELTDLRALAVDEHVTVLARIAEVATIPLRRSAQHPGRGRSPTRLEVTVTDGLGRLRLTFFNQPWRSRELVAGRTGLFAGKVSVFRGQRQLTHPDYLLLPLGTGGAGPDYAAEGIDAIAAFAEELIPVYPATAALSSWKIAQCIRLVLDAVADVEDPVPATVRSEHRLLGLRESLQLIHRPRTLTEVERARTRLRFDEAFLLQLTLVRRRAARRAEPAVARRARPDGLLAAFDRRLPFQLTPGQQTVGTEVARDLAEPHPMHRLLQGEVGSGKTVVALRAMLTVVDSGGQTALLAPTEVLAQQHYRSITAMLGPLADAGRLGGADEGTRVALLTGSQASGVRRRMLLDVTTGEAGIVVGTHALLQEPVQFHDLGLVVVDEQHRFGVEQRDALRGKAVRPPHVLVMTATPIPRTVAMTVFGDLEVSTLSELPAGRVPIVTHVVPAGEKPHYLDRVWERVREEVAGGARAYVVCPRIGDDAGEADEEPAASGEPDRPPLAVLDVAALLGRGPLAGLRIGILHGRLPAEEKDAAMRRFGRAESSAGADAPLDVLVATTVVEVGVDVPEATVMVVLDAERFGVSQLHQLRGRVGRGERPGLCLLVTDASAGTPARERLDAVAATVDGFALARLDLEQRREGDVLGAVQAGRRSSLRLLEVLEHEDVIRDARAAAVRLVAEDPDLGRHPRLASALEQLLPEDQVGYLEKA